MTDAQKGKLQIGDKITVLGHIDVTVAGKWYGPNLDHIETEQKFGNARMVRVVRLQDITSHPYEDTKSAESKHQSAQQSQREAGSLYTGGSRPARFRFTTTPTP